MNIGKCSKKTLGKFDKRRESWILSAGGFESVDVFVTIAELLEGLAARGEENQ